MKYADFETLSSNRDFSRVYNKHQSKADRYMVMYILENGSDTLRLGVSVSKKVGNSIVRHRLARLIRESFRLNSKSIMKGYDIFFVARNNLKGKGFYETQKSMLHLLKASSILMESENDKKDSDRNH